ncbi:MAG: 4Fe-4S binding protein [Candidatus Aquicultorales bacterium]
MDLYHYHHYRRHIQAFFLLLFLAVLTLTVWPLGHIYLGVFLLANPLIALNSLLNGVWRWEMLIGALVFALPFLLGRVYCGYICPFGTMVEILGPRKKKLRKNKFRDVLIKLPTFILIFCLAMIVAGSAAFLTFDPLSTVTRTGTTVIYPSLDKAARVVENTLYTVKPLEPATDLLVAFLNGRFVFQKPLLYQLQLVILGMFLIIAGLSFIYRRFWCRYLCPMGALLGFLSRFSRFGRIVDAKKCTRCGVCESVCALDAVREEGISTDKARCQLCFECADTCQEGAVTYGRNPKNSAYNPSRRALLGVTGLAVVNGVLLKANLATATATGRVTVIRPPGSRDEVDFRGLCSRCGQCMKVCPTNVLQPTVLSAGLEAMFTPSLNYTLAYCDWRCNECGKVCPTAAIEPLSLANKHKWVIGKAEIDRKHCMPWAGYGECSVCWDSCPVEVKAIRMEEERLLHSDGTVSVVYKPHVKEDICIGCGVCEFNCPVHPRAIKVKAVQVAHLENILSPRIW